MLRERVPRPGSDASEVPVKKINLILKTKDLDEGDPENKGVTESILKIKELGQSSG